MNLCNFLTFLRKFDKENVLLKYMKRFLLIISILPKLVGFLQNEAKHGRYKELVAHTDIIYQNACQTNFDRKIRFKVIVLLSVDFQKNAIYSQFSKSKKCNKRPMHLNRAIPALNFLCIRNFEALFLLYETS